MSYAWDRCKGPVRPLLLVFLAAGLSVVAGAQEPPKARVPIARTIILPPKMIAGEAATLAVVDSTGHLMSGAIVELSTGRKVTTDTTGRALFLAPSETGVLTAKLSGRETSALSKVVSAPISPKQNSSDSIPAQVNQYHYNLSYPKFLTLHDRFTVEGMGFNGRADKNQAFLAGQPCLIMAASPVSLVVLPGLHIPIGQISMRLSIAGNDVGPLPVEAVLLEFSGPSEAPDAGTQGKVTLTVQGATEPLSVEVWNGSPGVIQFPHGNIQRLITSGGEQNIAPVELKFLTAGNYTLTARLIPTDPASSPGKN